MKEYIDREAAIKHLDNLYDDMYAKGAGFYQGFQLARHNVNVFPAADVEEVVRCKECRHMTLEMGYVRFCNVWERPNGMGDDGFCNYGELRADA